MDFKTVDKKYRPIPFWSWNEKLDTEETRRQVGLMDDKGIGGYFMHARGGLLTEYMGDEWFDNVEAAVEEGSRRGMHSWAYDENGWPSGFGGGKVNGLGVAYQQKSLHREAATEDNSTLDNTLLVRDGYRYYYEVNPFYVDVLDPKVTDKFIEVIYEEYHRRFSGRFDGFFTDEPQIYRGTGYPWSFTLEEQFKSRYGYSLLESLDALFAKLDGCDGIRVDYWHLVTELFSDFFRRIGSYCTDRGYGFTGHLVCEESMASQIVANAACMPHYEYFTMPGMDWLGRPVFDCLTPMQVFSAAAQTGKKQLLSETFALSGHNVSHGELKRIYEWQMVHGINLLCTHLEGYSLRGIRKRDYPPAMYYQQPWWEDMKLFFDAMSRIGMLLAEGDVRADVLLIHPMTSAWVAYDGAEGSKSGMERINKLDTALLATMRELEDKHILYHLGDEIMMERHGSVERGKIRIGKMTYSTVILPEHTHLLPNTRRLIDEFIASGGVITTAEALSPSPVTEKNRLSYAYRRLDGCDLHYFVNSTESEIEASFTVGNLVLDPVSGETYPFSGKHRFGAYESILLLDDGKGRISVSEKKLKPLSLLGEWQVDDATFNSLTLDRCDYYFDGELVERDGYVLNILPRITDLRRPVELRQVYRFNSRVTPECAYIAIECPERFKIRVNGIDIPMTDCGYFRDSSFRLVNISSAMCRGENTVELHSTVAQSAATYEHLDKCRAFEAMRNCLSYDEEIEPVYIVGDFGVELPSKITELSRDAYRITDLPVIVEKPRTVDICALDRSGYPEFAGRLTLKRRFTLTDTDRSVTLFGRGINSVRLSVNGKPVATKMWGPYTVDISDYLTLGDNEITLTVLNNLRNMMGPHHLEEVESYHVGPALFFKESSPFYHLEPTEDNPHPTHKWWNDGICLVHFGLKE